MVHSLEPDFDTSTIVGNISDDIKQAISANLDLFIQYVPPNATVFGESIQKRLKVTELSIKEKAEEPKKIEARVDVEVDVTQDMLNGVGHIHGGCSAYLIDLGSSFAINALHIVNTDNTEFDPVLTVSQSLNIMCHAPATLGERLRIIGTTLSCGARALTARAEIWSETTHRLIASGTHVKMIPSTKSKM